MKSFLIALGLLLSGAIFADEAEVCTDEATGMEMPCPEEAAE